MSVKRYTHACDAASDDYLPLCEQESGEWVAYDDHAAEVERLTGPVARAFESWWQERPFRTPLDERTMELIYALLKVNAEHAWRAGFGAAKAAEAEGEHT